MVLTSPMRKNSLSGISGALDVAAASDITSAMLRDGDGAVNPYFILCESLPSASRGEAARCSPRTEILGQRRLRRFRDARVFDRAVPVRARSFRTTARWWNRRALSGTKLAIEIENVRERGDRCGLNDPLARRHRFRASRSTGGSTVCVPAGSHTVLPSLTGHGLPSTSASPRHATPTMCGESNVALDPFRSKRGPMAAAAGSKDKSGGRIEFSKYRATRGNALDARCTNWKSSAPVCCLVG